MFQRLLSCFALLILITACQQSAPVRLGKPQFTGPSFPFQAMDVEIVRTGGASPSDIQERYRFPTRLDSGMEQWIHDRIALRGGNNRLRLNIVEATVTEEELPVTRGFAGILKDEQSWRYTAKLKVELSLHTPDRHLAQAGIESEASKMTTVSEGASVAQRQQAFNDLVIATLQQIDTELSQRIPQYFGAYLEGY